MLLPHVQTTQHELTQHHSRVVLLRGGRIPSIEHGAFFGGQEQRSGVTLENSNLSLFWHFWRPEGHPNCPRLRFRRILSALWRKRKAGLQIVFLVGGAGVGRLAPFGCRLVAQKVGIVQVFSFLESRMEV